jgi:hypothetical protein
MSCRVTEQAPRRRNTARSRPPLSGVAERRTLSSEIRTDSRTGFDATASPTAARRDRDRRFAAASIDRTAPGPNAPGGASRGADSSRVFPLLLCGDGDRCRLGGRSLPAPILSGIRTSIY